MPISRRVRGAVLAALMIISVAAGCGANLSETVIRSGSGEIVPEHDSAE